MHALCERKRSHNPTLWVVTTTGDQHCRALHGTSKRERNSGLRALPAHAPALKPPRKARFLFSKSSISLLDCWFVFCFTPKFTEIPLENRAFGPVSRPEKPGFHRRNRAETGPKIDPQNHCDLGCCFSWPCRAPLFAPFHWTPIGNTSSPGLDSRSVRARA